MLEHLKAEKRSTGGSQTLEMRRVPGLPCQGLGYQAKVISQPNRLILPVHDRAVRVAQTNFRRAATVARH